MGAWKNDVLSTTLWLGSLQHRHLFNQTQISYMLFREYGRYNSMHAVWCHPRQVAVYQPPIIDLHNMYMHYVYTTFGILLLPKNKDLIICLSYTLLGFFYYKLLTLSVYSFLPENERGCFWSAYTPVFDNMLNNNNETISMFLFFQNVIVSTDRVTLVTDFSSLEPLINSNITKRPRTSENFLIQIIWINTVLNSRAFRHFFLNRHTLKCARID